MEIKALSDFIDNNPDPRELKRALAVQMVNQKYSYFEIKDVLQVSVGFISKYKQLFKQQGISGLTLKHQGSTGYLDTKARLGVIEWLQQKNYWNLTELKQHVLDNYSVEFASAQSYYDLFKAAGISWKKTHKCNPKLEPELVEKKQEITNWLEIRKAEISSGELVVLLIDECHLLWGDICGYVWGKTSERIEVPVLNERQKQTYYGALNLHTHKFLIKAYDKGNSQSTIAFLQYLHSQFPRSRIALIWDGASYHRSQEVRTYLESVNQQLDELDWQITCIRFAPNAPAQNPVEDVWLHAKRFIREFYHLCKSFFAVKRLFELVTHQQIFDFPKVFMYGVFS